MKSTRIKSLTLDDKLNMFFERLKPLAVKWFEVPSMMADPEELFSSFQDYIADQVYSGNNKDYYVKQIKRLARECGMKVAGLGRTRIALEVEYNGQTIVIKAPMDSTANDDEYKNMRKVKTNKLFSKMVLHPIFTWNNEKWGRILAYHYAPIIRRQWNECQIMDGDFRYSGFPRECRTEKVSKMLKIMAIFCDDVHCFNVGFRNGLPVLIDLNFVREKVSKHDIKELMQEVGMA